MGQEMCCTPVNLPPLHERFEGCLATSERDRGLSRPPEPGVVDGQGTSKAMKGGCLQSGLKQSLAVTGGHDLTPGGQEGGYLGPVLYNCALHLRVKRNKIIIFYMPFCSCIICFVLLYFCPSITIACTCGSN